MPITSRFTHQKMVICNEKYYCESSQESSPLSPHIVSNILAICLWPVCVFLWLRVCFHSGWAVNSFLKTNLITPDFTLLRWSLHKRCVALLLWRPRVSQQAPSYRSWTSAVRLSLGSSTESKALQHPLGWGQTVCWSQSLQDKLAARL